MLYWPMRSDDPNRQSTVVMKTFASGILMPPEKSPHLGKCFPFPPPSVFWIAWQIFMSLGDHETSFQTLVPAQLIPDKEEIISVYFQLGYLNPAFAFLICSLFQLLLGTAKARAWAAFHTWSSLSSYSSYVQLYATLLRWQTRDHGGMP